MSSAAAKFTFTSSLPHSSFQCSLDGGPWIACRSPHRYSALVQGPHSFAVRAISRAGVPDPKPARASWTVETAVPVVTLTSPAGGSTTSNSEPVLSGLAGTEPGALPQVTVDIWSSANPAGTAVQSLTATAVAGRWSVTPGTPLADGTYIAQALQSDRAGNIGVSQPSTFSVKAHAPAVTLTSPAKGSSTNLAGVTFSGAAGTARGDLPAITVKVYAGPSASGAPVETLAATASGGAWSVAASPALADGVYTVVAQQSDVAGNTGTSQPSTFTVDTTPPGVTLTSPTAGATVGDMTDPSFSGAAGTAPGDLEAITVNVYTGSSVSGSPVLTLTPTASGGAWSVTATPPLASDTYTAVAQQLDGAGNRGTSAPVTFTVAPQVTITAPANGTRLSDASPIAFSGTAGTGPGDSSTVLVNLYSGNSTTPGALLGTISTTQTGGSWSASPSGTLGDGTYTLQATQANGAITGVSAPVTFTVAPP